MVAAAERPRRTRSSRRAVLGLVALLLPGCGGGPPPAPILTAENPDRFLYERGVEALKVEDWLAARERFRQLVDGYPQSPYRADAKLGIGDSYMGQGSTESYILAVAEFREFLSFYPTHPQAAYAQQQIGEAYFQQMRAAERDQTATHEAIREFETFIERYPNSPLLPEVQLHLRQARDRLSESEYRVGLFYYRIRWYPGAIQRFRQVLEEDPGFSGRDAVYYHLARALIDSDRQAEALPYFHRLVEEFEQSEYLDDARRRITELGSTGR